MLSVERVVDEPETAGTGLAAMPIVQSAHVRAAHGLTVIDLTLAPMEWANYGYASERIRIRIQQDGSTSVIPLDAVGRTYLHRFSDGSLCMFYPKDPRPNRWEPEDGLEQLVAIAWRHVYYEEFARRNGRWPVPDAPHRPQATHQCLPSGDQRFRREVSKWM